MCVCHVGDLYADTGSLSKCVEMLCLLRGAFDVKLGRTDLAFSFRRKGALYLANLCLRFAGNRKNTDRDQKDVWFHTLAGSYRICVQAFVDGHYFGWRIQVIDLTLNRK